MSKVLAKQAVENERASQQQNVETAVPTGALFGEAEILNLQNAAGNQAVITVLSGQNRIQRQVEGPEEEEEPFETSGLGQQGRMQGHGDVGSPVRYTNHIQRQGGGGGSVTANPTFTSNNPTITRAPAADIGSSHGQPDAAGWTTPRFDFQVPFASISRIDFNVTMDYDMELASDFTGATLGVLQDHEMGHVNIGKKKGKTHLVSDLESQFEGMSALSLNAIRDARDNAVMVFQNEEGVASQDYDSTDYPRMHQAYLGARTPLADLEASSPTILQTSTGLRVFNSVIGSVEQSVVTVLAQNITSSAQALSADDRSKLQYNPEFKALVGQAQQAINGYLSAHEIDFFLMQFNLLADATMSALEDLQINLAGFTWQAPS